MLDLCRWVPNAITSFFTRGKPEGGHVTTEAEVGTMWPQAKGCQKLEAGTSRKRTLPKHWAGASR